MNPTLNIAAAVGHCTEGIANTYNPTKEMNAATPCCTHLQIKYVELNNTNGTCSDRWECAACGTEFAPYSIICDIIKMLDYNREIMDANTKLVQQRDAKTQERDKLARENDALTELLNQQSKEVSNMNNKTCIHHNDKEREEIECPVCLKKERNEWQGLANDLKQANEMLKRVCDDLAKELAWYW